MKRMFETLKFEHVDRTGTSACDGTNDTLSNRAAAVGCNSFHVRLVLSTK